MTELPELVFLKGVGVIADGRGVDPGIDVDLRIGVDPGIGAGVRVGAGEGVNSGG
jgi:hypothetical protein